MAPSAHTGKRDRPRRASVREDRAYAERFRCTHQVGPCRRRSRTAGRAHMERPTAARLERKRRGLAAHHTRRATHVRPHAPARPRPSRSDDPPLSRTRSGRPSRPPSRRPRTSSGRPGRGNSLGCAPCRRRWQARDRAPGVRETACRRHNPAPRATRRTALAQASFAASSSQGDAALFTCRACPKPGQVRWTGRVAHTSADTK